jgi:hypothetical protein
MRARTYIEGEVVAEIGGAGGALTPSGSAGGESIEKKTLTRFESAIAGDTC